ncbi:COP23 domain-containing protein [Calothrix sp. PCC 6303]|uniref:COP23 domain-containing protein n=1 Tax=Calothrix sp. PCC 6303 TaxID=1170562 RepID=UPI0021018D89|nr:COP23 domain-containing protein [Calothrix sp. PCC 6303]
MPTVFVNSTQPSRAANADFYCAVQGGIPTTFFTRSDNGKRAIVRWTSQVAGLSSKQRCFAVSRNFQKNLDNGTLILIIDGVVNRQRVICGAVNLNDDCTKETLLFTLKPGSSPKEVIRSLLDKRGLASGEVQSQTSDSSRVAIKFEAYLGGLIPEP